jgi:hypothetical protein
MESNVHKIAKINGFKSIQSFAIHAGLSWPVAKDIWNGDISNKTLKTALKVSVALGCNIEDLFQVDPINERT